MNGTKLLVDTNVLLYVLDGNPIVQEFLNEPIHISEITVMELMGVKGITNDKVERRKRMIAATTFRYLNDSIRSLAISLKQQIKLKLPDAIIAATALHLQSSFITADQDFKRVPELKLLLIQP